MTDTSKITYSEAVDELDRILKELENSELVDMDRITTSVKRATFLMEVCRKQLHDIEEEMKKIVEEL